MGGWDSRTCSHSEEEGGGVVYHFGGIDNDNLIKGKVSGASVKQEGIHFVIDSCFHHD